MKTRNVKVGDKIVILHKGFDTESKWKKEGIVTGINKNLHILWGTWGNAIVSLQYDTFIIK
jgi:hypothetical protein